MFLTNDTNKHPLSMLCAKGHHLWTGTELQMRRIWFMVEFEVIHRGDDEMTSIGTVLLSTVDDVLSLAKQNVSMLSVYLMTPFPSPEGGGWDMTRLTRIWEAVDPGDLRLKAKIYARADGRHHVESNFETTADQLDNWELLLELTDCATTSADRSNELH